MGNFETAKRLFLEGLSLLQEKEFREAEGKFLQSLELVPDRASTLTNLSAAQLGLKKFDEAGISAEKAIATDGANSEAWLNRGSSLHARLRYDEALADYARALDLKPDSAQAWLNKGVTLSALNRFDEAHAHYDRAIALKADYAEAWSNKGLALRRCGRDDEALAHHDRAIALQPGYAEAWYNKGLTLFDLQRYDEAVAHYDQAIARDPGLDLVQADRIHTKLLTGDWHGLDGSVGALIEKLKSSRMAAIPFSLLSITDSPEAHRRAAQNWVDRKYPANPAPSTRKRSHNRIRIGYFSADFRNHPVSHLIAELVEIHDRERFEILGFSLKGQEQDDEMRTRLRKAFDGFIDVELLSDADAARLSTDSAIDIAVDLAGHTRDARTGIFSHRAAPIQVNYLGYPSTMGAGYMDYLLADKVVCPPRNLPWYTEKLAWLPHCFMPHDGTQEISKRVFTRQDFGLPETGLVFCCFNNHYKLNPTTFDVWMRLLAKVTGSALWLSDGQQVAKDNLAKEARARGVDPARLVYAPRLESMAEHLGRYRLADLFIDTLPYNAHSTACDALWAGVPVLTCTGRSFASRVAASLLHAVGLPELVTGSLAEYEALALELATQPQKLAALRDKLAAHRLRTPLFDTRQLTRDVEQAYTKMFERLQTGLAPDNIEI